MKASGRLWLKIVLVILVLAAAGVAGWTFWLGSADGLTYQALASGKSSEDRVVAAVHLSQLPRKTAITHLRRIAQETSDPDVEAAAIRGLGEHNDKESIPLFMKAMASDNEGVRQSGFVAAHRNMEFKKGQFDYFPDYPKVKRDAALAKLRENMPASK